MTGARSSVFRTALQVSSERVALLRDAELNELMRELLRAHAYRCGASVGEVRVNTEGNAKDDGSDGWSPKPPLPDDWFGDADTCWQFKAGTAGTPSQLRGEVTKRIPKETLAGGGRFVVVASGSTSGKRGENNRLKTLRDDAARDNLPTKAIDVLGSERLSNWVNQYPALAAIYAGRPAGLWRLEAWARCDEHKVPWQSTPILQQQITDRRRDMDLATGTLHHLHIQGPPGVGKTRFALELCRGADWRGEVIYIRQATDVRLAELIDSAVDDEGVRLVVVADEVQGEQLRSLRDSLGRGRGRVRLITIGHCKTPDPNLIPAVTLEPLARELMSGVIRGWHPAMPPEHVDFAVRVSDGYVRLARLVADQVMRDPAMDVRALLDLDHIRSFLDSLLGAGDRTALYVVAALISVGWTEDRQAEGEAIAQHFGFDWNHVRARVEDFDRRVGIAPRSGRYRYISPTPLGNYLAVEAWKTFPDLLRTLPEALPTEEAKDAYYERLQAIASNPQARLFAREQLSFFFRLDDFIDPRAVRRWSALSAADPTLAARNISHALTEGDPEDRKRIAERARREVVWTLVRLTWKSSAFRDAALALALLAEAENETWSNNATGEFLARFQVFLGGTAVPYVDRLEVIDELLTIGRSALIRLVVKALSQVGDRGAYRMVSGPASDEVPETEWRPATGQEYRMCAEQAIARLTATARTVQPALLDELLKAAGKLSRLLRNSSLRGIVSEFFEAVRAAYPDAREPLRRVIADVLYREQKYWKELPAEEISAIEVLRHRFEDPSLGARLRQYVGQATWDPEEQVDLRSLAAELIEDRDALAAEWPWLTSGDAEGAWRLGDALAARDAEGELDLVLPMLECRGRDLRVICGYLSNRRKQRGTNWFDDWIAEHLERNPSDTQLLFEAFWRCGATIRTARLIAAALRESDVEVHVVQLLSFGRWGEDLPREIFAEVLQALADRGHRETAISLLSGRLKSKPPEAEQWDDLALALGTSSDLVRSEQMVNYHWKEVASRLVPRYGKRIAAAILREQADRESGTWFAEFSNAKDVLRQSVEVDPEGVWEELMPHLTPPANADSFAVGFPRDLLEQMPEDAVFRWMSENVKERASIAAKLVTKDLSNDGTMASRLVGAYGDIEDVGGAFFSAYVSGSWTGPTSAHWASLAGELAEVARRTKLPKLRRWADDAARSLRRMAEREIQREEEEELRGR